MRVGPHRGCSPYRTSRTAVTRRVPEKRKRAAACTERLEEDAAVRLPPPSRGAEQRAQEAPLRIEPLSGAFEARAAGQFGEFGKRIFVTAFGVDRLAFAQEHRQ